MAVMSRKGWLLNLREGPTPYADAWALQKALIGARQREELADGLILLEHEPVFTIGRSARRLRGFPGVWAGHEKIAAVGVAVKRKVTMHGFALNVGPDLAPFDYINPCGIGRPVTSMARLLGRPLPVDEVRLAYARRFAEVFDLTLGAVAREDLLRAASGYAAASA